MPPRGLMVSAAMNEQVEVQLPRHGAIAWFVMAISLPHQSLVTTPAPGQVIPQHAGGGHLPEICLMR